MEISKCMGCMEQFQGYPCPNCGYDPEKQQGMEFALPMETIVGGKYLTGRVLGQGGFGITYIGWDIALERKVAIKEYYPSGQVSRAPGGRELTWYTSDTARSARQDGMEMFLKEARKMAKLEEIPGVVKVRDLFQENETAYIVMDFVEGKTLKARLLETGPLSWDQVQRIFFQAIRSMELVHEAGLIHRDLSPDNLMITPGGGVKILDLGAAKDLKVSSGASSMQVAKGGFSPYEQYTQRGGSGPWTDVYAMAATIYYTLTGRLPPSATDRVERDTLSWNHPNLLTMPAPALKALKKAMAVLAKDRTQTMAELEKGLFAEAPKPPVPIPKPPVSVPRNLPKWVIPAAAAVLALACGIGVWTAVLKPANDYKAAAALMDDGKYAEAAKAFTALGDYRDSSQKAADARKTARQEEAYQNAISQMESRKYFQAMQAFSGMNYKDSDQKAQEAKEAYWQAQRAVPLDSGVNHTVGLCNDGTVVAVGLNEKGQCGVTSWRNITAVSAGGKTTSDSKVGHTVGLRSDGTVVAVGFNEYDQCRVSSWKDIVSVKAGALFTVGLRGNGTVVATGSNYYGQCDVNGWSDIVAVAAGGWHTVGLCSDGTVVAAGDNEYGQCNVSGWTDIVAVAAGYYHTVGLRSDGTVVATSFIETDDLDYDDQCLVGDWTDIVAVAAGGWHTVGLRSDGTVVATGYNDDGRCDVSSWTDIVAVAAGTYHTLGLRSDGTVVSGGRKRKGLLRLQ